MNSAIDYIRLASWGHEPYTQVVSNLMTNWPDNWKRGMWLQYAGWRKENFFLGIGNQNGKRHAVLQASGNLANTMYQAFVDYPDWYCTRIDVQRTLKRPEWVDLSELYKLIGKKGLSLISSEENDTLYLGSRSSDIFTRLYEKPFEEKHLRLEFELKGQRAKMAWLGIKAGEEADQIFDYYLDKCKLPAKYIALFKNANHDATKKAMTAEVTHSAKKKLAWIISLDDTVRAAIGDHEIGERVKILIRSWSKYSNDIDING